MNSIQFQSYKSGNFTSYLSGLDQKKLYAFGLHMERTLNVRKFSAEFMEQLRTTCNPSDRQDIICGNLTYDIIMSRNEQAQLNYIPLELRTDLGNSSSKKIPKSINAVEESAN